MIILAFSKSLFLSANVTKTTVTERYIQTELRIEVIKLTSSYVMPEDIAQKVSDMLY